MAYQSRRRQTEDVRQALDSELPKTLTIGEMTPKWERLFHRKAIGSDENFFVLGGDRTLADRLFAEIEAASGRAVPSAAIDYAPTIASLCALLSREEMPVYRPFVQMRSGSMQPPVLIVHALGGSIGELYEVVNHIETGQAVYGIEGRGVDGLEEAQSSIEDMAESYLIALEKVQPGGPYLLIGYSLGGLIAFEMAQRLSAAGRKVRLLTMIDAVLSAQYLSKIQHIDLAVKRLQYHIYEMRKLPFPAPCRYINRRVQVMLGRAPDPRELARKIAEQRPLSFASAWNRTAEKGYAAIAGYRPSFFQGRVRYVTAAGTSFFLPRDLASMWKPLVARLDTEVLPGNHVDLIHSRAAELGAILTQHIREATGE